MSIPIPLVLALLSQKPKRNPVKNTAVSQTDNQLMLVKPANQRTRSNLAVSDSSIRKLKGVAQIIGGTRGQTISRVANVMSAASNINKPMNALSLLMNNSNAMNSNSMKSAGQNTANLYNGINSMLSNMDSQKKAELMGMAQDLLGKMK